MLSFSHVHQVLPCHTPTKLNSVGASLSSPDTVRMLMTTRVVGDDTFNSADL